MALPSSGLLTTAQIRAETGLSNFSMGRTQERNLAGRPSGIYQWDDYWGQTGGGICTFQQLGSDIGAPTCVIPNQSFGATAWNRRIFCTITWSCTVIVSEAGITSASIGGVAATIHLQYAEGGTSALTGYGTAIISALVPNGTSGNINITFGTSHVRTAIVATYRATGYVTAVGRYDYTYDFGESPSGGGGISLSGLMNVPSNGLVLMASVYANGPTISMTPSGATVRATGLHQSDGYYDRYAHGMNFGLGAQVNRTMSVSGSVGMTGRAKFCAASFQLA